MVGKEAVATVQDAESADPYSTVMMQSMSFLCFSSSTLGKVLNSVTVVKHKKLLPGNGYSYLP